MAQRKLTEADTPTIRMGTTLSGLIRDAPPSSPHFYAGCPSCRKLQLSSGLRQAPNMLACIHSGMVQQQYSKMHENSSAERIGQIKRPPSTGAPRCNYTITPTHRLCFITLKTHWHDTTCCQTGCQLKVFIHDTTGCQTVPVVQCGLTTGWTNSGCSFNTVSNRLSNRFDNWLDVCLPNTASCETGCTTGCRFDNRLYRVNGV